MQNKSKIIYVFSVGLMLLIGVIACLWFYINHYNKKSSENTNITRIKALPIISQDITLQQNYIGYVEAIHQVQITPYISGYLQDILITPGQMVKKGEPLVTIEDAEYKAKLDAAEATVLKEQSSFEYNKNYYDRVQKSGKKAFSQTEIDNAKNNFQQSEALLKNALANKTFAHINYDYTKISAPISGLIGNINLSKGDYVTPTKSLLMNIVQTDPIRVVFSLTDKEYLDMLDDDQTFKDTIIKLRIANGGVYKYNGEFKYTDNQINKQTNSIAVYAYFKNDKNILLPNEFVTVEIFRTFKNIVLINKDLIQMKNTGNFVTIYRNGQFLNIPIQIITDLNTSYAVKNTFQKHDLLILNKNLSLPNLQKSSIKLIKQ